MVNEYIPDINNPEESKKTKTIYYQDDKDKIEIEIIYNPETGYKEKQTDYQKESDQDIIKSIIEYDSRTEDKKRKFTTFKEDGINP